MYQALPRGSLQWHTYSLWRLLTRIKRSESLPKAFLLGPIRSITIRLVYNESSYMDDITQYLFTPNKDYYLRIYFVLKALSDASKRREDCLPRHDVGIPVRSVVLRLEFLRVSVKV